jgi:hypothetical protein
MKFENTHVSNFEGALHGMRNPLASWKKSDSCFGISTFDQMPEYEVAYLWAERMNPGMAQDSGSFIDCEDKYAEWLRNTGLLKCDSQKELVEFAFIGPNDMDLAMRLCRAGSEHRKFLRQIQVSVDITAPIYWWKEFDTYKTGTTANSTSTMHKLASTPITMDCFELDDYEPDIKIKGYEIDVSIQGKITPMLNFLEQLRLKYNETKDKRYWKELIRWLPEGWLQTRTVTMNYENLRAICHQRSGHKLTEWHQFIDWVHDYLPYAPQLVFDEEVAFN